MTSLTPLFEKEFEMFTSWPAAEGRVIKYPSQRRISLKGCLSAAGRLMICHNAVSPSFDLQFFAKGSVNLILMICCAAVVFVNLHTEFWMWLRHWSDKTEEQLWGQKKLCRRKSNRKKNLKCQKKSTKSSLNKKQVWTPQPHSKLWQATSPPQLLYIGYPSWPTPVGLVWNLLPPQQSDTRTGNHKRDYMKKTSPRLMHKQAHRPEKGKYILF